MIFCVLIAFKYPDFWTTFYNFQVFPPPVMSPSLIAALFRLAAPCTMPAQPGTTTWKLPTVPHKEKPAATHWFLLWMPEISQPHASHQSFPRPTHPSSGSCRTENLFTTPCPRGWQAVPLSSETPLTMWGHNSHIVWFSQLSFSCWAV